MADEEMPAADVGAADGHVETDERAPMELEAADHEIAAEVANANGVAEADPQPVETDAAAETQEAAEAPRERSKHASQREDEDDPRERRRDEDGALPSSSPPHPHSGARRCSMLSRARVATQPCPCSDVRRAALWHAVNVSACPHQTCEGPERQILSLALQCRTALEHRLSCYCSHSMRQLHAIARVTEVAGALLTTYEALLKCHSLRD